MSRVALGALALLLLEFLHSPSTGNGINVRGTGGE
jgi:hypothetical protein